MMADVTKQNGIVLIGGGGHALVVADAADSAGVGVAGFFDDDAEAVLGDGGFADGGAGGPGGSDVRHLGSIDVASIGRGLGWLIAVGDVGVRAGLIERLRSREHDAAVVVHASAVVSPSAVIGRGVFVGPRAVVNARAQIGEHAIVNSGAVIEHECVVGVNTHVAPGAVLGGAVRVGANTLVGIGAAVLPGVVIGSGAVVGAGAVVIEDVADGERVVGSPARMLD
jgi:sugar O-acyltransferase (sialic acid O-acetyltransferase NeuD family)